MVDPIYPDAPMPAELPEPTPKEPTFFDTYRQNHPEFGGDADIEIARKLYTSGGGQLKDETFPAFATRLGYSQNPLETLLMSGGKAATLHIPDYLESGISGVGSLLSGDGFAKGYRAKQQERSDEDEVGHYQNPKSDIAGNIAGNVADYVRFGPLIRETADMIPAVKSFASKGPMRDAIVKMFGLAEANEIPKLIQQEAERPGGPDLGNVAVRLGLSGAEGAGSAVVGSGVSKLLSAGIAPFARAVGEGFTAADDIAKGLPRTLYTKALTKLSRDFTGENNPAEVADTLDNNYYSRTLNNSGINVDKGVADLSARANRPGWGERLMNAVEDSKPKLETQPLTSGAAVDQMGANASSVGVDPADVGQSLQAEVNRLRQLDPSGEQARQFIANIYKRVIRERLEGSFDPEAAFNRNTITGRLSDDGKLVSPPLTGIGRLFQELYERTGGAPARVMLPLLVQQPRANLAGFGSLLGQGVTIPGRALGGVLKGVGGAADALAEPGTTTVRAFGGNPHILDEFPNPYQSVIHNRMTDDRSAAPPPELVVTPRGSHWEPPQGGFPDYHQPQPQPERHSSLDLGTASPEVGTAFIAQRLGPQVAQQISAAGPSQYKSALFALMSNPQHRQALAPDDEDVG